MAKRSYELLVAFTANTCGFGGQEDEREVYLLSWQVIDTTKAELITEIETCYVCPDNLPPSAVVGVSVDTLSKSVSLEEALKKFESFLSRYSNQSYCLATNGCYSLRQMLFPEISRKRLAPPLCLYKFFDIQKECNKKTNNDFQNITSICNYFGIDCSLPDDEIYGQEEIKLMANIVQCMLKIDKIVFESPEMIQQHYQHCNQVNSGDVCIGCVVKLRGLPFSADHKDIAKFLAGLNIIPGGLAFGINAVGRRTGEAIVVLENEEQANLALQRHRHYLNQRYIEVYEASPEEFLRLVDNSVTDNAFVIRMQGLPYRATENDIVSFYHPDATVKNNEDGVMIVRYPDGKASGDAFCLFSTEKDVEEALKKHKMDMMGRYIELFHSSLKEFLVVLNKSGTPEQLDRFAFLNPEASSSGGITAAKRGSERNCVKLRGLPWEARPEDVIEFFGELDKHIEQQGIHMVLNAQNRPTGDCYVQMTSVETASKAAAELHKHSIGRRYIEVFQCSGDEVTYALMDSAGGSGRSGGSGSSGYNSFSKRKRSGGATVKARGLPYSTSVYDLVEFFCDFHIEESDVEMVYNQQGRSTGVAFIAFSSHAEAKRAIQSLNNRYIGRRYVELSLA